MTKKMTISLIVFFGSLMPMALIIGGKTAEKEEILFWMAITTISVLSLKSTLKTIKRSKEIWK
jgi:hypothetical protein